MQADGRDEETLESALERLKRVLARALSDEQRRDQLTGLQNDLALRDAITDSLDARRPFWLAFIEIDKFKSVNDRFGYLSADALLKEVARKISGCSTNFLMGARAYRAHGDEFYLFGDKDEERENIEAGLNSLKSAIAAVKIVADKQTGHMQCTVSIGWLKSDFAGPDKVVTDRSVLAAAERAVAAAKRTRNAVVEYSVAMTQGSWVSLRADCRCGCRFSVDADRSALESVTALTCPLCGEQVSRPPLPAPPNETAQASVLTNV